MFKFLNVILLLVSLPKIINAQPLHNFNLDPDIKTIQLYNVKEADKLGAAIMKHESSEYLILEFDDLRNEYRQFHVKVIKCDINWEPADIRDIQFLYDYNDFIINDYVNSSSTKVPYFHYGFRVPTVKSSGNYVLQLFENDVYYEPILQRRFRVYEQYVNPSLQVKVPVDNAYWRTHHQLELNLSFRNYEIRDPKNDFKVLIRQNYRDDKIKKDLKPSGVNFAKQEMYFRFFENENLFAAGNEFRVLDISSTFSNGLNIASFDKGFRDAVYVSEQTSRNNKVYIEQVDLNGTFLISNLDNGTSEASGDYLATTFTLNLQEFEEQDEYFLLGRFNDFTLKEENKCIYIRELKAHECSALLKQGVYDFSFAKRTYGLEAFDEELLEGNYSQTGNAYEVYIYHKHPRARTDRLVGYYLLKDSKQQ